MPTSRPEHARSPEERLTHLSNIELTRLIAGKQATPLIVAELARRAPADLARTMARLVLEDDHPVEVRAAAAIQMREHPALASEPALLQAVKSRSPTIKRRAAEALGHSGGKAALPALARLHDPADGPARRSLQFARHLLAYRHGIAGHELAPSGRALPVESRLAKKIEVERATPTQWRNVYAKLPAGRIPFEPATQGQQFIVCGPQRLLLVFDQRIQTQATRTKLMSAPAVVAVLLGWSDATQEWILAEYILGHPETAQRMRLLGVRPNARNVHLGEAWLEDGKVTFRLQAVAGSRAPALRMEGSIEGARVPEVSVQAWSEQVRRGAGNLPRQPSPVDAVDE